nr:TauD/TfdA family dioxygenase [Bradyrhizobium sp. Ghvi]
MHTDDAALPRDARTEYINLYGIVNPPGTLTSYAAAADALSELDPSTIAVLRQERFSLRFPTSFGFAAELWSAPCPIIAGAGDDIELRFPSYATRASRKGDEAALAALKQLMEALNRHAVGFPLDPGCVLTFNNFRGAHKRDAIGKGERLVFRTYSCRSLDFLRDVSGNPGPIFSIESFAKKISA